MSSIMRCRRDVMESSFAKWNVLQAAAPWFRKGTFSGEIDLQLAQWRVRSVMPTRLPHHHLPRSGLVQDRLSGLGSVHPDIAAAMILSNSDLELFVTHVYRSGRSILGVAASSVQRD